MSTIADATRRPVGIDSYVARGSNRVHAVEAKRDPVERGKEGDASNESDWR